MRPRRNHRRGYTLIEVLLALTLSVMLMSAVYGALHHHYVLKTRGTEQVKFAQAALGLMHDFAGDVERVRSLDAESDETNSSDRRGVEERLLSNLSSAAIGERLLEIENDAESPILLHGTSRQIVLTATGRNDRFQTLPSAEGANGNAEQIVWAIGRDKPLRAAISEYAGETRVQTIAASAGRLGLLRVAIPTTGRSRAERGLATEVLSQVKELRFRYFDGSRWLENWSTAETKNLPRAIEVVFWISGSDESHRVVLALPGGIVPMEGRA